jgi:formylglycine-generating enzyme required for sulfatase activity
VLQQDRPINMCEPMGWLLAGKGDRLDPRRIPRKPGRGRHFNHFGFGPRARVQGAQQRPPTILASAHLPSYPTKGSRQLPISSCRLRTPAAACLILSSLLAGCQLVAGYEEFKAGTPEPPHRCDVLRVTKTVTRHDIPVTLVRVDIPGADCFWIDKTEVTVEQYDAWLENEPEFTDWYGRYCEEWKLPGASDPAGDPEDECRLTISDDERDAFGLQKPIRCVDWCDAEAFCRAAGAGTHLCYDSNWGGALEPEGYPAEWRFACTSSPDGDFPWGDDPDTAAGLCNVDQPELGCGGPGTFECGPATVGQWEDCTSDHEAQDLIGNVAEWVFLCSKTNPTLPTGGCRVYGGSYAQSVARADCSALNPLEAKGDRLPDLGFRCCSPLTADEMEQIQ